MKYPCILLAATVTILAGCTSVNVRPVTSGEQITEVVIRRNPKVAVDDFLDVLIDGFRRHGIASKIISEDVELKDTYVVNYVAYRNWDMAPYLTDATISIDRNGRRVAEAQYHLKLKGGLALTKWQGTRTKIDPVMDQLLTGIAPAAAPSTGTTSPSSAASEQSESAKAPDLYTQLVKLDDLKKRGILSEAEFETQKKKLLEQSK
jgi:hypothetical protein